MESFSPPFPPLSFFQAAPPPPPPAWASCTELPLEATSDADVIEPFNFVVFGKLIFHRQSLHWTEFLPQKRKRQIIFKKKKKKGHGPKKIFTEIFCYIKFLSYVNVPIKLIKEQTSSRVASASLLLWRNIPFHCSTVVGPYRLCRLENGTFTVNAFQQTLTFRGIAGFCGDFCQVLLSLCKSLCSPWLQLNCTIPAHSIRWFSFCESVM